MKILSRMLSKKDDPQNVGDLDDDVLRDRLDDAGQVHAAEKRVMPSPPPIEGRQEEPEVAGTGWAEASDWDDDWDDDEDWGDDDDVVSDAELRQRTEDKAHLVSEIRDAMVSVSHATSEPVRASAPEADHGELPAAKVSDWSEDEDFGRRARARSQLSIIVDEDKDRLMEKTEDVMSEQGSSRRRSALAHMKAAAAATKADRVLQHVTGRDSSADPEEQSPYRDDLAKVVRPHSTSRPISRQVSRPNATSPVWDQGAGDEDAALFAAAEEGIEEDLTASVEEELSAAEADRLARIPDDLSAEDFADDDDGDMVALRGNVTSRAFPSSRFAVPEDEAEDAPEGRPLEHNSFDDFDDVEEEFAAETDIAEHHEIVDHDEMDDPFGDDDFDLEEDEEGPQPSRVVSDAVAFANAPDEEEFEEQPEAEVRKKIWEMADEVASQVETAREEFEATQPAEPMMPAPEEENVFDVSSAVAAGRAGRSAGRVKTRLLGFQADEAATDVFAAQAKSPAPSTEVMFPTGWLVVISGPGRGASFALHNGVSQIGRGDDQTVRLDFGDTSISRNNHAAIAYDDEQGQFFLGHGGKSNLVRLNGSPVLSTEEMSDGDEIRIGETSLKFVALCGDEFTWNGNGDEAADA